jgi:3-methyladenine DNA glycosylase AlkC
MTASQPASLKDMFDQAAVDFLAGKLAAVCPSFDAKSFSKTVAADLPALELKARAARIADGIRERLPGSYAKQLALVRKAAGKPPAPDADTGMGGFRFMPFLNFVGRHGLDAPELSLAALAHLTCFFSAEFDVRPYLLADRERALAHVEVWAGDSDWRVRRLASEGIRPRLPWAMRLPDFVADPTPVLGVIARLCADPHPIVRRSVANNLNDIAKDHPGKAVAAGAAWLKAQEAHDIVRHGLRTLVKAGNGDALKLLGFEGGAQLVATDFALAPKKIALGEAVTFSATLRNDGRTKVRLSIDYAVHHRKANGGTTAKVFKLAVRELRPGESCRIEKRHAIRAITTRRYHAGLHALALLVNGRELARGEFMLRLP